MKICNVECVNIKDIVEFNFKDQGVKISVAQLIRKIDKIVDCGNGFFEVYDFKTGKPPKDGWNGTMKSQNAW